MLIEKILLIESLLKCRKDFSGLIVSSESIPVVTKIKSKGPFSLHKFEALEIEFSSSISIGTLITLSLWLELDFLDNE